MIQKAQILNFFGLKMDRIISAETRKPFENCTAQPKAVALESTILYILKCLQLVYD